MFGLNVSVWTKKEIKLQKKLVRKTFGLKKFWYEKNFGKKRCAQK